MKTRRSSFKRMVPIPFLALLIVLMQNCVVDVPPEDPDPPTFSFRIIGDGFDHTFTQDTDFNNITLMLRFGVKYEFTFMGYDGGGMDHMGWYTVHSGHMEIDPTLHGDWNFYDNIGSTTLEWYGDTNNPLTGSILRGTFTTEGSTVSNGTFRFTAEDYGGESGRSNSVTEDLQVFFGAHSTRIRDY